MDAGGGNQVTLATTGQQNGCLENPWVPAAAWSPDGQSLIYPTSPNCNGRYDLYIVATDGSSAAAKLLAPGINSYTPAWSPDGTQIAFQGREPGKVAGLYVAEVGAADALAGGFMWRRISSAEQLASDASWAAPVWSPDGTEVVAAAGTGFGCDGATAGTFDIYMVQPDGSSQRAVVARQAEEVNPTWSADGRRLAFERAVDSPEIRDGQECSVGTWVIDADGTNKRRLDTPVANGTQLPLWSPDGTRVLTNWLIPIPGDAVEPNSLYVTTVDGSSAVVTIDAPTHVGLATWQPVAAPLPPAPSFAAVSPTP